MTGACGNKDGGQEKDKLAESVFAGMAGDDPVFKELRSLLLHGRRSEAINLICRSDKRFDSQAAQELVKLVMNTLRDTIIDP